jgi:hypothetical protein
LLGTTSKSVLARRAVDVSADLLEEFEVLVVGHVLGALEHHVLEEVREPGPLHLLVLRAHVVHRDDGHDGGGAVLMEDDVKPVRQRVLLVEDVHLCRGRRSGGDGGEEQCHGECQRSVHGLTCG